VSQAASTIESFGKYLLLERLAAGGMAEVYLAKSFGAGGVSKFVAVKRILPQFSDNQEFIDMFKEEAKLVMNLSHSNIVSIYDFGIERRQFYLVMEYVEGQNLRQVLTYMKKNSKYFSIDQIVYIAREAASGLDHAHRSLDKGTNKHLNITHRDMSPQNVMLSFEGEIKIVDFGIAKAETQLEQTRSGTIKGKFGYMSPEQAEGQPVDARTDIFSLGIVLWELLAQDRLFSAQSETATLKKIRDCIVPPIRKLNPAVDVELERIVAKCLTKDRVQRYQTSEDLTKDLGKFLNMRYPDFSKQEFSKFLKDMYQEAYLENREKLARLAQIEMQVPSEKTALTTNDTSTGVSKTEEASAASKAGPMTGLHAQMENSVKVDLNKLKTDAGIGFSKTAVMRRSITNSRTPTPNPNTSVYYNSGVRKAPQQSSGGGFGSFLLFVAVLAGGGYWYLQNNHGRGPLPDPIGQIGLGSKTPPKPNSNQNPQAVAQPPTASNDTTLSVQSEPAGATVYVDDSPVGTTPMISHIQVGRVFRLKVVREGYLPMDSISETAPSSGYNKRFTLMAEPPSGTITVDAFNAGASPVVYVGNQVVARQLPAVLKIPAGSEVSVRVVNPIGKIEGIEKVVIGQGQKKSVRIILNREAQIQ